MSEPMRLGEILPMVLADIEKRMQRVAIQRQKAILDAQRSMLERATSHETQDTRK